MAITVGPTSVQTPQSKSTAAMNAMDAVLFDGAPPPKKAVEEKAAVPIESVTLSQTAPKQRLAAAKEQLTSAITGSTSAPTSSIDSDRPPTLGELRQSYQQQFKALPKADQEAITKMGTDHDNERVQGMIKKYGGKPEDYLGKAVFPEISQTQAAVQYGLTRAQGNTDGISQAFEKGGPGRAEAVKSNLAGQGTWSNFAHTAESLTSRLQADVLKQQSGH